MRNQNHTQILSPATSILPPWTTGSSTRRFQSNSRSVNAPGNVHMLICPPNSKLHASWSSYINQGYIIPHHVKIPVSALSLSFTSFIMFSLVRVKFPDLHIFHQPMLIDQHQQQNDSSQHTKYCYLCNTSSHINPAPRNHERNHSVQRHRKSRMHKARVLLNERMRQKKLFRKLKHPKIGVRRAPAKSARIERLADQMGTLSLSMT